jgi:hypothetical protein
MVVLSNDLSKKISAFKKARGKDWDKELGKAIDSLLADYKAVLAAEELLLTPKPGQKLTEAQAIREAVSAVKKYRAQGKKSKQT